MSDRAPLQPPRALVWWIIWGTQLAGLLVLWWNFGFLKLSGNRPSANPLVDLVGLLPIFISIIIRWLVLPRYDEVVRAFAVFIAGVALAEAGGIIGIFLGGPYRDSLFVLGVLGIAQYVPLFVSRLGRPKGSGFIPNN